MIKNSADILRVFRSYRLSSASKAFLFLKRLNDTFEENVDKLIQEGKSEKEVYGNKNRHYFFVSKEARWIVLSMASENIVDWVAYTR